MQKIHSLEELSSFSKATLVVVILSMRDQLTQLNTNMECLIEQVASANNHRYGRPANSKSYMWGYRIQQLVIYRNSQKAVVV